MTSLSALRLSVFHDLKLRTPNFSCQGALGEFIDKYLVAETIANKLVRFYVTDTNLSTSFTLKTRQLIAAMRYFDIVFVNSKIKAIFISGTGKSGAQTPRQLRNSYMHSLSKSARLEVENRSTDLLTQIEEFINSIPSS
jgi:hypothetical protein